MQNEEAAYLSVLNDKQKEAVLHKDGPLLVFAGAGAGKTKTVTHRILHLIKEGVTPEKILAVTFTNKAAAEMKERVKNLIASDKSLSFPYDGEVWEERGPEISTFHVLGAKILRKHAQQLGRTRYFSIFDRDDSIKVVKSILKKLSIDPKQFDPAKIMNRISHHKGNAVRQNEYEADKFNFFAKIVMQVWEYYEKELKAQNAFDFDDLIEKTLHLLKTNAEMLSFYQNKWEYIHVDEYQDTNESQYQLIRLLADKHKNICVVGDNDQSIYGWRGADYTNILNFETDYPKVTVVTLEENYRSTKNIIAAANDVIKKNKKRKDKNLFTNNKDGHKISLVACTNEAEEAYFIAKRAKKFIQNGVEPSSIAVLYRANFQSRILEEAFLREEVPHQVLGVRFFARKEVKDIISYLKAALNENDLASIERIINVPARGIGKVTVAKLFAGQRDTLNAGTRAKVDGFYRILSDIREKKNSVPPSHMIAHIAKASGLEDTLKRGGADDIERFENIQELVTLAGRFDSLPPDEALDTFLGHVSLATSEQDSLDKARGVKLMTVHAAKGLEFSCVFVSGLEEDLFPHAGHDEDDNDDEEERRLFYVAITRAEEKLFLTYAQTRTRFGQEQINMPSSFLFDIDEELVDAEDVLLEDAIQI